MLSFGAKYRKKKSETAPSGDQASFGSQYHKNTQPIPSAYQPVEPPKVSPINQEQPQANNYPERPAVSPATSQDTNKQLDIRPINGWDIAEQTIKGIPASVPEGIASVLKGAGKGAAQTLIGLGSLFLNFFPAEQKRAGQETAKYFSEQLKPTLEEIPGYTLENIAEVALSSGLTKALLTKTPTIAKFAETYPKIFDMLSFGTTGTELGQVKSVEPDASYKERLKQAAIDFGSWTAWGAAGELPMKTALPSYFSIGYLSSILEGKTQKEAVVAGLSSTAIGGAFKLASIPKKTTDILKQQSDAVLKKYNIKTAKDWKVAMHKYHPDISKLPEKEATRISAQINAAWSVRTKSPQEIQRNLAQEFKDLFNSIKTSVSSRGSSVPSAQGLLSAPQGITPENISSISSKVISKETPTELRKKVIEAKDKLSQPENIANQKLKDEASKTGESLSNYEQANKENVVSIKRPDGKGNAIEINVVPVGKKWAYDYSANTGIDGISAGTMSNELKNSKEEAIASAKKEITDWVNKSLSTAQDQEKVDLNNILNEIKTQKKEPIKPVVPEKQIPIYLHEETVKAMERAYRERNKTIMERPIAVVNDNGKLSVLEGEHRFYAAKEAGVEPPMVLLTRAQTDDLNAHEIDVLARKLYTGKNTQELTNFYNKEKTKVSKSAKQSKEIKTAREAAVDMIKHYVERGDDLRSIRSERMGSFNDRYHAEIGGYVNGKPIKNDKIVVMELGGKELTPPQIFSLKELFDEIKNNKPIAEQPIEAPEESGSLAVEIQKAKAEGKSFEEFSKARMGDVHNVKISTLPERATAIGMGKEEFDKLSESISKNGIKNPIIIRDGQVIDGMRRSFVAKDLGMEDVPAMTVGNDVSLEEARNLSNNYSKTKSQLKELWDRTTKKPANTIPKELEKTKKELYNQENEIQQKIDQYEKQVANEFKNKKPIKENWSEWLAFRKDKLNNQEYLKLYDKIKQLREKIKEVNNKESGLKKKHLLGKYNIEDMVKEYFTTKRRNLYKANNAIDITNFLESKYKTNITEIGQEWNNAFNKLKEEGIIKEGVGKNGKKLAQVVKPQTIRLAKPEVKKQEPAVKTKTPRFAKSKKVVAKKIPADTEKNRIGIIKKIIGRGTPSLPVLGNFLVKDGKAISTDLDVWVNLNTDLKNGVYKIVGNEAIKTDTKQEDFPLMPEAKDKNITGLNNDKFSNAIKSATLSVGKNDYREELNGIYLNISAKGIEVVSTDSFRLYRKTLKAKGKKENKVILSSTKKLSSVLRFIGDSVDVGTNMGDTEDKPYYISMAGDRGNITVRGTRGRFPEFHSVYPALTDQYFFNRKEMLAILKELKPFVDKSNGGVGIQIKDNKMILKAENRNDNISKELSIPIRHKEVNINAGSPQDGTMVMPMLTNVYPNYDSYPNADIIANVKYLTDAVSVLDEDEINLCKNKEKETPFIIKGSEKLVSVEIGTDHSFKKGTPLFHGTTANNAASIISDGIYKTEDKTATYGKAIYLTPDYQSAQDYSNETGHGQVVTIKTKKDLNLYEPTTEERDELVSITGQKQDEMISRMLRKGNYDGLYIPDDGRGDGGEQVILYNDDPENFEKAVLADEPRTDKSKVVPPIPSGNASTVSGKLGEFEKLAQETLKKARGKRLTEKEMEQQLKDNKEASALWDKLSEYDKNYLFNLLTFPDWEPPKTKRAPSGLAASGAGRLGNFEDLAGLPKPTPQQLKLYEEVKALIQKYAKTIGEGYTPSNALGVYYGDTKNIRINGMNDLSVASHEITHFLDFAYHISDKIMGVRGYSKNGKPLYDKSTAKLRKEMTDLYERYYPGGKRTHKLRKRMLEGFATMLQKYIEQPSTISATYPNIIKEFLSPEGKYYKPVMGDIINDLRDIISRYQGLDALDKIGSRVVNGKINVNKDSFLNFFQKVKTEIADNVYPIELLAKKAGVRFTKVDPSLWIRQYNSSSALILNNINGNRGYWGWRNGELVKLHDFNFKDLITDLKKAKLSNEFGFYLVARREHFAYQELAQLKVKYEQAKELKKGGYVSLSDPQGIALDNDINAYLQLKAILDKDGLTEEEVSEAYLQNKDRFKEYEEKYDILVGEDMEFLNDPAVQLLSKDQLTKMKSQSGYASFKRAFYDEVVGEKEVSLHRVRFGSTKVSSLLKRTGSQKPIINPLFSALTNHAEITRKGLKQIIYNRVAGIAVANPDFGLFQKLQLKGIPDRTGRILYPQEKDPNIIMARIRYKRVPFLVDSLIKKTIDEILDFHNIHNFEKILMGASRFFTKGTTGLFPGFALTNYAVDQATAIAQTRNNYIPIYDPLNKLIKLLDSNDPEHIYLQEYLIMGGERQTFVGWQDLSPDELFGAISNEKAGLSKVIDYINSGADILALPSKWSEIATRATEYVKSRRAGKTPIVALEEAGRVTAPFHHIGRWGGGRVGQSYLKSIPFFNPAIEVLAQALETLETPEGRKRYAFVVLAITAASVGALGLIMAFGSDEQKQLYADLHPDELNKYIWLPNPDKKSLIKIRVPDQMAILPTLINMYWADKKLQANYTAGEYLTAGVSWLPQELDPSDPARALISWIPQIIKPGVLTLANTKDFPTIMPLESEAQKNKPAGLRYNGGTSVVAKWVGEKLNLSPIKIDYLLNGYVGRVSGFLTGKPGVYNPLNATNRKYYFSSGRRVQSYYNMKQENDRQYYAYKHKLKKFNFGERSAIIRKRKELKAISKIIGDYRAIDLDKEPDKAAKLRKRILDKILKLK